MNPATHPHNFSRLKPFLPFCDTATPIFMYHKVGHRPRGVKHRSIYLSHRWFSRQMRELKRAGFSSDSLSNHNTFGQTPRRCVLTFDDGSRTILLNAAKDMQVHGFQGIQYLVAGQLGGYNAWDVAQGEVRDDLMTKDDVRQWLAMGHEIGSHTVSHPRLAKISREKAREEIFASKARLEDAFSLPIKHFCYPYGSWNEAVADMVREAGYETATTTDPGLAVSQNTSFSLPRIGARYPKRSVRNFLLGVLDFVRGA